MGGVALLVVGAANVGPEPAAEANEGAPAKGKDKFENGCLVQRPQKFLERQSVVQSRIVDTAKLSRALRYLAENYGNAGDDVTTRWNAQNASAQAKTVKFMGLPVSIHAKIAPALACVQKRIQKLGHHRDRYTPKALGGFRVSNTYRGAEVSNHLFGIAIDIDPDRNPCCGCVDPWPSNPLCKVETNDVFERTALTKAWIHAFERYGFDWLGHDDLQDTMHFEFLGDPDRITR